MQEIESFQKSAEFGTANSKSIVPEDACTSKLSKPPDSSFAENCRALPFMERSEDAQTVFGARYSLRVTPPFVCHHL